MMASFSTSKPQRPQTVSDVFVREAMSVTGNTHLSTESRLTMQEKFRFEFFRLSSFKGWPKSDIVSPLDLAKVGLVYAKKSDETICYLCSGKISQWNRGMHPVDVHRTNFPFCPISKGEMRGNVPLMDPSLSNLYQSDPVVMTYVARMLHTANILEQVKKEMKNKEFTYLRVCGSPLNFTARSSTLEMNWLTYRGEPRHRDHYEPTAAISKQLKYYANNYNSGNNPVNVAQHGGNTSQAQVLNFRTTKFDIHVPRVRNIHNSERLNMRNEADRRLSFFSDPKNQWKAGHIVQANDLAKCGFFFLQDGDRVQCAFCKGVLKNWERGDQPEREHKAHFPTCPRLMCVDVGNIPLPTAGDTDVRKIGNDPFHMDTNMHDIFGESDLEGNQTAAIESAAVVCGGRLPDSEEMCHLWHTSQMVMEPSVSLSSQRPLRRDGNMDALFVDLPPCHPEMISATARKSSFDEASSPADLHGPGAHSLSAAGFFLHRLSGEEECVVCFWCGGGLVRLSPGDCPWLEHARWMPRCPWVYYRCGEEYINRVVQKFSYPDAVRYVRQLSRNQREREERKKNDPSGNRPINENQQLAMFELSGLPLVEFRVEAREIKARMDTEIVRTLIAAGFYHSLVRYIVELRLRKLGNDYMSATALAEACMAEEDKMLELGLGGGVDEYLRQRQMWEQHERDQMRLHQVQRESEKEPNEPSSPSPPHRQTSRHLPSRQTPGPIEGGSAISSSEWRMCKICMDSEVNVVFLPCGHLCSCSSCAPSLRACPICRAFIRGTVRTFVS